MANIKTHLNNIKNAILGKDVRDSIHDAIEQCYTDASLNGNANMEVSSARGAYETLGKRLDDYSSQLEHIENVKANKDDIAQISDGTPLFATSSKEMTDKSRIYVNISDGYVYVNSDGTFVKSNILYQSTGIANGSITLEKLSKDLIADNENSKQMYSDLYLAKTITNEVYRWRDLEQADLYNPNKCVDFDGSTKSIVVTNNELSSTYDWFAFGEEISQFEASWDANDLWVVLKYNGSSQAVALHLNNSYNVRVFDRSNRTDYHSATIVNTSAKLNSGGRFRVSERSTNLFVVETQQGNNWVEWLNINIGSIPNINSYKKGYGGIVYSGILGQTYFRNVKVSTLTTETIVEGESLINEINNTINLSKQNKLEIDKIKKETGSSENGGTNNNTGTSFKVVDLVMFMGQSNMAGRGVASQSPVVPANHGYEFRAISDPTKLYNIVEPFGVKENNGVSGVTENSKTGSMVSSFVSNYYQVTKVPIVAVSCSKGGTKIEWWQPNGKPLNDAIERHNLAKEWLIANGYTIRHDFMVWCQGCSDGDSGTTSDAYKEKFKLMVEEMMKHGVEKCFIVRIGNHRDNSTIYDNIISAQTELGRTYENAVLVSTKLSSMAKDGLMKDQFHYTQEGYNIVGKDAGINTAFYINNLKEPTMWDWENQNLYYSYKN